MGSAPLMLLQPIQLGPLLLRNRMVRSPMLTGMASADGEVTDQLIDHYAFSAKSGVAMVIVRDSDTSACDRAQRIHL